MALRIPRKLIEVALPLDDINAAASREKSIRHGHPSTLHIWWARRPLAAARAVLFAQLVNDPGGQRGWGAYPGQTKEKALQEREELFDIIRELVKWENTNNEAVLGRAREAIRKSWRETCDMNKGVPGFNPEQMPAFHDPFAGGGAIPLEAQRLGLVSNASDLNPVAVLINKAMIEVPPLFADLPAVGPVPTQSRQTKFKEFSTDWNGTTGIAEDVSRYGQWIREQAKERVGKLYPDVDLPNEYGGGKAKVIAWLWARTVKSPNPAFRHVDVPLASTFLLSVKKNNAVWVEPVVEGDSYTFVIRRGEQLPENAEELKNGTKMSRGANFRCILSGSPIEPKYIKNEGLKGRMGARLMAIVADGAKGRIYLAPSHEIESIAQQAKPSWQPDTSMPENPRWFSPPEYGMPNHADLFTKRQLLTLSVFSDLVGEARTKVHQDALKAGMVDDEKGLQEGGRGAFAYADAICLYLGLVTSKMAMFMSTGSRWRSDADKTAPAFGRHAIAMVWDYAEINPFAGAGGDLQGVVDGVSKSILAFNSNASGRALQHNAATLETEPRIFSTDPPYYDNIGYSDLSDYFYIWLRRTLHDVFPSLLGTLLVPKEEELVANQYRHGGKANAEKFFLAGMAEAMHQLAQNAHPAFPTTIYYAFKQSETKDDSTASTGWETFLEAVVKAGFIISGTWPMRTENATRLVGRSTNALASSIVLVCGKREDNAADISRREFLRELRVTLPEALEAMIAGRQGASPIAPVDLAQAAIGPGMGVFSRYHAVLEADGSPMPVRSALTLINKEVDAYFFTAEGDLDAESRFCLAWFDQYNWNAGSFGEADVLARAKGTSVAGVQLAGGLEALSGKVRLLRPTEYPTQWNPTLDARTSAWEGLHHLIRVLRQSGETPTGRLLAAMPALAEPVRQLAYRLYTQCERMGRAEDARAYNELIIAWPSLQEVVQAQPAIASQTSIEF